MSPNPRAILVSLGCRLRVLVDALIAVVHLPASLSATFLIPTWGDVLLGVIEVLLALGGAGCLFSSFGAGDFAFGVPVDADEGCESLDGDGEAVLARLSMARRFWRIYDENVSLSRCRTPSRARAGVLGF
jgi:hypothetical protein